MYGLAVCPTKHPQIINQWSYVLSNFRPAHLYIIGTEKPEDRPFQDARLIASAEEIEEPLVLLTAKNARYYQGEVNLLDFDHPRVCTYMLGPDGVHLSEVEMGLRVPEYSVYVDTDTDHEMYSFMAYGVAAHHRRTQWPTR